MFNFDFLKKGPELVSPPLLVFDFSRKRYFVLYSINSLNFTFWLPLLLEILNNMCIVIVCCPICDVIDFEFRHSFLIKPVFHMTKKKGQKFKYISRT